MGREPGLTPDFARWNNPPCYGFHNLARLATAHGHAPDSQRGVATMEVGETLELVFVFIMITTAMALLVAFGQWWQR